MCEAATIAMAATAISTGLGVAQSISQGKAARAQANYQAAVARNNKIIANRAADQAEETGRAEAIRVQQDSRALRGRQRAVLAANGVDLGFGTTIDLEGDTAALGEIDALTFQERARRKATDLRFRGDMFESEAQLAENAGETARRDSLYDAGTTLATGITSVAGKWQKYKNPTAPANRVPHFTAPANRVPHFF